MKRIRGNTNFRGLFWPVRRKRYGGQGRAARAPGLVEYTASAGVMPEADEEH
ncbi:MAG: hypothetical protein LBC88_00640 [Spirochaetaceae bacterium]|nr:hypothetical protein [Spirochaetaceae bacterium]